MYSVSKLVCSSVEVPGKVPAQTATTELQEMNKNTMNSTAGERLIWVDLEVRPLG